MNRPENPPALLPIPDVQSGSDERQIAIDHVGIKGLRYPLPFADQDGVAHTTIAICNVYVALPAERKGTHMSRLVALLDYDVRLAAELVDGRYSHTLTVAVPVTSLCPSSKEIAEYGAHNQRSIVTVAARPSAHLFVGELL